MEGLIWTVIIVGFLLGFEIYQVQAAVKEAVAQFGELATQLKLIGESLEQINDHAQEIKDYGKNTIGCLAGTNERIDAIYARIGDKTSN